MKRISNTDQGGMTDMGVTRIGMTVQGAASPRQSSQDNIENNIRKRIAALQEKMESISNDEEKTKEQKTKEKQATQEQIQNLNNELRQHQIQKSQEEAAKKQEAIKQAFQDAEKTSKESETAAIGLEHQETGVMISLSGTKEHLEGLVRLRTNLEGKQRTAETKEEKDEYQKKINRVEKGIGQKATIAASTISDLHKTKNTKTVENEKKPIRPDAQKEEIFWAETKPSDNKTLKASTASADSSDKITNHDLKINQNKMFDNASLSISK